MRGAGQARLLLTAGLTWQLAIGTARLGIGMTAAQLIEYALEA